MSKDVTCNLWNTEVHYYVHNTLLWVPCLSEISPVPPPHNIFLQIYFNIVLCCTPRCSKQSVSIRFSNQPAIFFFFGAYSYMLSECPPILSSFCLTILRICGNEFKSRDSPLCSVLQPVVTSFPATSSFLPLRSKYSPRHPILHHPQSVFFL